MEGRLLSPSTPSSRGMDKYEQLAVVGEGSYGVVLKCRRRDTGQYVAIKKFLETEDDSAVRKMALREIRMLKKLRHEHLVNLIEVFRRKRRFYLVFEYLDHTLLDELEACSGGLGDETTKKHLFQLLKGIDYCHQNAIIHRDVKPENVLVDNNGIVKLCDLGFARTLAAPGEPCTEYVATRWYRAPELLVAEHRYGTEVDIWAIGCLFAEMLTGDPLFPGDSDIDQLALIVKTVGKLAPRHQQIVAKLSGGAALRPAPAGRGILPATGSAKDLMVVCLRTEPRARPSAAALLRHKYFSADNFIEKFTHELRKKLGKDIEIPTGPPPQQSTARKGAKAKPQWTLNIIPDKSRSSTDSNAAADLIDLNFNPSSETMSLDNAVKKGRLKSPYLCPSVKICQGAHPERQQADTHQPPPPPPTAPKAGGPPPKTLAKALNEAFHNFNVPVNEFPRTPYIKKVKNRLILDEDLRGRLPLPNLKTAKKAPAEFTLPYVPGASNSPMKKAKKPPPMTSSSKGYDTWDGARGADIPKTPTNLPYM